MAADFPLFGPPTISLAQFTHILQAAHSPAAGQASGIYQAFVSQGVNPAIGLAIAQHESAYGKLGAAVGRNNLFGDRFYASAAAYGATKAGGFAHFPSYTANAQYEAHLLATSYRGYTALSFARKYAPSSDHNNPDAYGKAIVRLLNGWSGGRGGIAAAPHPTSPSPIKSKTPPPKKPAATSGGIGKRSLVAYAKAHPKTAAAETGVGAAILAALL
jgi:hypothetical protein